VEVLLNFSASPVRLPAGTGAVLLSTDEGSLADGDSFLLAAHSGAVLAAGA
jgi:maltooligosyltrehalose trehalohydrolase